jgi:hypothetical protein
VLETAKLTQNREMCNKHFTKNYKNLAQLENKKKQENALKTGKLVHRLQKNLLHCTFVKV